jgi:hypothetical protein
MTSSIEDQIACVRREIKMRQRVFPRWVAEGRKSQEEADREIRTMQDVQASLEEIAAKGRLL